MNSATVHFNVTGANAVSADVTTDLNGEATFTYFGRNAGTDTVVASGTTPNTGPFTSNPVTVSWIVPQPRLTSTSVTGRFFTADGSGAFNTAGTQQPVFTQLFPNVNFNPVNQLARPFSDVVTDGTGVVVGSIPAQGNGFRAGAGTLYNFSAVFTGALNVPAAGPVTFSFLSDDAFVFGVGNGATRVSGPLVNTPGVTAFQSYAVMGGVNQRGAPVTQSITVNFPAAGVYPYELDYAKGGDNKLTLSMLSGGVPIQAAVLLKLTPPVATGRAGTVQEFVLSAATAEGLALSNLPVLFTVTGSNQQTRILTTDGTGQVGFAYAGSPLLLGGDQVQAGTVVNGAPAYSNVAAVTWNNGVNQAPLVSAGPAQSVTLPALAVLNGVVNDDGLPGASLVAGWTKVSGPGDVVFDSAAQAITAASFSLPGTYVLQLSGSDGVLSATATVTITVNGNSSWSSGWLATPLDGSTVTQLAPVTLVPGVTLTSGVLKVYPASNAAAAVVLNAVTTGTGQIGTLDPTVLNNGQYFVELVATNTAGVTQTNSALITVGGDYKPGRVVTTVTDFVVPSPGLPIRIARTYDSLVRDRSGDFGYGWNLDIKVDLQSTVVGDVTLTIGGRRRTFYFTPESNPLFVSWMVPRYTAEPGMYGSLVNTGDTCTGVVMRMASVYGCAINNAGAIYQALGYRYTDPTGRVYVIGADGSLQSIQDLNGNTLVVTPTGITNTTSGLTVPFVRDASGRITRITDTNGSIYQYGYDAAGNLANVTLPGVVNPWQYVHDSGHLLTKAINPAGVSVALSTYYADGKLKTVSDAVGNTSQYIYDLTNRRTTATNPDGGTVVTVVNSVGKPLSITDPLGRTTNYSYDAQQNVLTVTDALNKTSTFTYDSLGFRTSRKDPLNHQAAVAYNQFGKPTTITDAANNSLTVTYNAQNLPTLAADSIGQLARSSYDARGNLLSFTDSAGSTTTLTYDAQGNVTSITDALNRATLNSYDNLGRVKSNTSPRGGVTAYTYDPLGHLTLVTDATGKTTRSTYDANGNRASSTDALNRTTTYTYDAANRLIQTTYPDGTSASTTFDWRGNILSTTDQAGRVVKYEYDLAGRLTKLTSAFGTPDAISLIYTYDGVGRRLTESDARGNVTSYSYDDAGHVASVTDASNKTTTYTYDAAGRRVSVTDANLHATLYTYDARNRLIRTTFQDGTTEQSTYNGNGFILTATDRAGAPTTHTYDLAGQLTMIGNPLNQTTQYGYDADGNWTALTDANSHTTTQSFDALGRLLARTYPASAASQTNVYDGMGRRTSTTDLSGKTTIFTYDPVGRLLSKTPDPTLSELAISFSYTATGRRATMSDASGTTTYSYNNLDQLTSKATPQGTLTYTYDLSGNVASVRSSNTNGVWLSYTYDGSNRLISVVDNRLPTGQNTTIYNYDAVGNEASVSYPNGVRHSFTYDGLDRISQASLSKAGTLANYTYQRGLGGQVSSVGELSGRTVALGYDAAYRLLAETVAGDTGGRNGVISYGLDPVANRLSRNSTIAGITPQSFQPNSNDQSSGEGYDLNGNVILANGSTYSYDFLNRLKSTNGGAVTITYDGDDNRVSKTVSGATTRYLVDDLNPTGYVQVLEEISGGVVQRSYAFGLVRISQTVWSGSTATTSFYGYDGQENVRQLTDGNGGVTDTYDYDSFGGMIASTGSTGNLYRYRGEQWDPDLGLYYLRARYYSAQTGRFLTRDPQHPVVGNVLNHHRYLYAGADPVNRKDALGLLATNPGPPVTPSPAPTPTEGPGGGGGFGNIGEYALLLAIGGLSMGQVGDVTIPREFQYELPGHPGAAPVITNNIGYQAKCIGNLVDSLVAEAAEEQYGINRRVACHFHIKKDPCRLRHPDWPVNFVHVSSMPFIAFHVWSAQQTGHTDELSYLGPGNQQRGENRKTACPPGKFKDIGMSCDEYPYASTQEGGEGASAAPVPLEEQRTQGQELSQFYRSLGFVPGTRFCVQVVP